MTCPRSGCHPSQLFSRQSLEAPIGLGGAACQQLGIGGGQIGVQAPMDREQGTPLKDPIVFSSTPGSFSPPSLGVRGSRATCEGCSRSCSKPQFSRVLRTAICGPQIVGGVEACSRPLGLESLSSAVPFQNGNGIFSEGRHQTCRLGSVGGPQGCVFPCAHPQIGQEIPTICMAGSGLSIYSRTLRPGSSPLAFHQDNPRVMSGGQGLGHTPESLLGRLAPPGDFGGSLPTADEVDAGEVPRVGVYSECGEVRPNSMPGVYLPGNEVQYVNLDGVPISTAHCTAAGDAVPHHFPQSSTNEAVGISVGFYGIYGPTDSSRTPPQERCSEVVHGIGRFPKLVSGDPPRPPLSLSGGPVAGPSVVVAGRAHYPVPSTGIPIHGCLSERVGCSHGFSNSLRLVESGNVSSSHQPSGAGGSVHGTETIRASPHRPSCSPEHGQHDGGMLSEQAGGGSLLFSLSKSRTGAPVVSRERCLPLSKIHTGEIEHSSGFAQQITHGSPNRVDASPQGPGESVEPLVQAGLGPICDQVLQTASSVCVPGSRSRSVGDRRSVSPVGSPSGLRFSTLASPGKSTKESKRGKSNNDSDCSSVGGSTLVPRSSRSHSRRTPTARSRSKVPTSTSHRSPSQKPRSTQPSRVASVRESLSARGASTEVISLVEQAHRPGTKKLYDARWSAWYRWCMEQNINPRKPSRVQFANYLAFLANTKKLSASTVKGHRASISTTIKQLGGHDFSEDTLLKDLVKGVSLQEARSPKLFPAWDLKLVLDILRSEPYEPIRSCALDKLTFKTVFLISLASGRRCSEVHALHFHSLAWETDGSVSLRFIPGFLAKNQPLDQCSPPIVIKALAPILCPDDIDRFLCPIRCLKSYIKRTSHLRSPSKKRLFISPLESKTSDISVSSISRYIKNVIKEAYCRSEVSDLPDNMRAHEVRAWATSLAWANNTSLSDIMNAAYWFGRPTFFQFYLRDVSHKRMDGSRGISMVAAQQVLKK